MKNPFKKGKQPLVTPRQIEELNKELSIRLWELGSLEYQSHVLKRAVDEKKQVIEKLNYEGAERKRLDEAASAEVTQAKKDGKPSLISEVQNGTSAPAVPTK